jgi:glycine/D-amino acid oxidase-like deaminating enzyme
MMTHTEILIIGQGICGTFLARELDRVGIACKVLDEEQPYTASKAAAGLINPVTGRRIVKTWMIDELLPFVKEVYQEMGQELNRECMTPVKVVDFFPTPQMRLAFMKRYEEDPSYLQFPSDDHDWDSVFQYELGYGMISPCYLVDLPGLLAAARKKMKEKGILLEDHFDPTALTIESIGIRYKDIQAAKIIFCDGAGSFDNPWFSLLPFAPNKGEALLIEIENGSSLPANLVFKKGMSLAPWKEGLHWVGSSYEWSFTDKGPTEVFRTRTEGMLKEWLKLPFRTIEHIASVRPATLERRPFVGMHPHYPTIGILNGMGTKGCSLAPYFARQLAEYLKNGAPIQPDADIKRFSRILARG